MAPSFGGINLEDIASPAAFEIERRLIDALDIPVFHDDQHGTAIVTLAALDNALELVDKRIGDVSVVISGAGAAGVAVAKMLHGAGAGEIVGADRAGAIHVDRRDLNDAKRWFADNTNPSGKAGLVVRCALRRRRLRRPVRPGAPDRGRHCGDGRGAHRLRHGESRT